VIPGGIATLLPGSPPTALAAVAAALALVAGLALARRLSDASRRGRLRARRRG